MHPRVSIICVCYNHEAFVETALTSVFCQTYSNIQVIVIDDCSSDSSRQKITAFLWGRNDVIRIFNEKNAGNCASFNEALKFADGDFVIDFSTDDVLLPYAVESHVNNFNSRDERYGVSFSDAYIIDKKGKILKTHYRRSRDFLLDEHVPEGDVYEEVVKRYFINPPSLMIRKKVLEDLGGYDEKLKYEDFDFWIRSSRKYYFSFIDKPLVMKRTHSHNLSKSMNSYGFQNSTYRVCLKALWLNKTELEDKALESRLKYELRQAFLSANDFLVIKYRQVLKSLGKWSFAYEVLFFFRKRGKLLLPLYKVYLWGNKLLDK